MKAWPRWLGRYGYGCWLFIGAMLLAGCSYDGPPLKRLPASATVLAFGDSLTFGTGAAVEESYPAQLEQLIGRTVIRSGVPGELSGEALARLPAVLEQYTPALVILCHGGNDILRKQSLAAAEDNIRAMVRLSRAAGAEVVLLGVPKPGLLLSPAQHYDRIAEDLGLPYLRETLSDILGDSALKADTVHPNGAGYRALAAALAELLEEAGALPISPAGSR